MHFKLEVHHLGTAYCCLGECTSPLKRRFKSSEGHEVEQAFSLLLCMSFCCSNCYKHKKEFSFTTKCVVSHHLQCLVKPPVGRPYGNEFYTSFNLWTYTSWLSYLVLQCATDLMAWLYYCPVLFLMFFYVKKWT